VRTRSNPLLALLALFAPWSAEASIVVVPDDHPTVQLAIDSGADTVVVRSGDYPERPLVSRGLVLRGAGETRPRIEGLDIINRHFAISNRTAVFTGLHFLDEVSHTTTSVFPRNLQLYFMDSRLDSGFVQTQSLDPDDIAVLSFERCVLGGHSTGRAVRIVMEADTLDGSTYWSTQGDTVRIRNSWFRGGPYAALSLSGAPIAFISNNRINDYLVGIEIRDVERLYVQDNVVDHCGTGVIFVFAAAMAEITANVFESCGVGVFGGFSTETFLRGNVVLNSREDGVQMRSVQLYADHNVIGRSGDAAIRIERGHWPPSIVNNTLVLNGESGVVIQELPFGDVVLERNIGYGNGRFGFEAPDGTSVAAGCNDWFANTLGTSNLGSLSPTDRELDPVFCDVDSNDVRLAKHSPLASGDCGATGAMPVGCALTSTLLASFTVGEESGAVVARWRFPDRSPRECWLERALARDADWTRVAGNVRQEGEEYTLVVAGADRPWWYRVSWKEDGGTRSSDAAYHAPGARSLRLWPNPSFGPIAFDWSLPRASDVELVVHDLAGRRVATLARGGWPGGSHRVEWDGRERSGRRARPGWYVARLRVDRRVTTERMLILN
jgi:hypothetical protein